MNENPIEKYEDTILDSLLKATEVAEILNISKSMAYRLMQTSRFQLCALAMPDAFALSIYIITSTKTSFPDCDRNESRVLFHADSNRGYNWYKAWNLTNPISGNRVAFPKQMKGV